jgi:hypothetical protein
VIGNTYNEIKTEKEDEYLYKNINTRNILSSNKKLPCLGILEHNINILSNNNKKLPCLSLLEHNINILSNNKKTALSRPIGT